MGTISGSGVSNVVTTGTFTIPLMKANGYDKNFAGAGGGSGLPTAGRSCRRSWVPWRS